MYRSQEKQFNDIMCYNCGVLFGKNVMKSMKDR